MKNKRSLWTSLTGGLSSAAPILLSCCKSGACIGVCASPLASLFGVSSAGLVASPLVAALEPLLIALSAVSFTVSYYSLYVLPKAACATGACSCAPTTAERRRERINKAVFWLGLLLSIGFLSYFEYSKYRQATAAATGCTSGSCEVPADSCCPSGDTTACTGADASSCDSTQTCCPAEQD